MLDDWIAAVKSELGIDLDVDVPGLLDMTRDVAHGVARPAAPLTAFLVGYAAAQAGGGAEAVAKANRAASALAVSWSPEADKPEPEKPEPEKPEPEKPEPAKPDAGALGTPETPS